MKSNIGFVLFIALVSALGGLLFGYDWVVIGGAKPFYEQYFGLTGNSAMQGWAMSSALIGCLAGALSAGALSNIYGRKRVLIAASLFFLISAYGTGAVDNFSWFVFYRIAGGFGIGLASNVSPMYISEVSPAHLRGRLVAIYQFTVVLGILCAQIVNYLIAEPVAIGATGPEILASWNGQLGWRWMFWAECLPATLFFALSFCIPESPRWLALRGRTAEALAVFHRIAAEQAPQQLEQVVQTDDKGPRASWHALLRPKVFAILLVGIVLSVFQQWCGINVIFNYAQEIFQGAGYTVSDMLMNIVVTGVINVVFTILAMLLVDRLGRRPLLLAGSGALCVIYLLLGGAYYLELTGLIPLVLVLAAIAAYAMTLAPIVWVVVSEIFPNSIRSLAMSICTFALWSACFVLTYTFPLLNSGLGTAGTFWIYGAICLLGAVFCYFRVPETKGKSLEQIEEELY